MQKLWPPTFSDFSIRCWAAMFSGAFNLIVGLLIYLRAGGLFVIVSCLPGLCAAMLASRQDLEGADFSWLGLIAGTVANLLFYYLAARFLIIAFRPATNWWPAKHS
jgi:hypothetical protein